jgi:DNA replication protein DnaC
MMMSTEWHGSRYWRNRQPKERVDNAHIPRRYIEKTLDNYDEEVGSWGVVKAIRGWMGNFEENRLNGEGLYLCGSTGTGKTHLAAGLLSELLEKHKLGGFFITTEKFVEASYDEIRNDGELPMEYGDEYLLKYLNAVYDVVVIDGLGSEKKTEFTKGALVSLFNSRYEQKLITIVTSEYSITSLSKIYGPRLSSILQDSTLQIPFEGKDYRITQYGTK